MITIGEETGGRGGVFPDAAIVLAGGAGRRLGGVDKAVLVLGSATLLDRMLAAVGDLPVVVVGPPREVPSGVTVVQEDPPGGGPAAGVVAGLAALRAMLAGSAATRPDPRALIAVLAVDQPGVTKSTLARLASAVPADRGSGAVLVDAGHRQYAAGVFPEGPLTLAGTARDGWHGVALRLLLDPLVGAEVPARGSEALDVDTPADLARWQDSGRADSQGR